MGVKYQLEPAVCSHFYLQMQGCWKFVGELYMVEVSLKSESNRPAWFLSDDPQVSDAIRGRMGMRSNVWRPATDVYELEDAVVVRVEIAGMSDGNFSIS